MGLTLKEYIVSVLRIYKDYPEMKGVLREIYEEWYGNGSSLRSLGHETQTREEPKFCVLEECSS